MVVQECAVNLRFRIRGCISPYGTVQGFHIEVYVTVSQQVCQPFQRHISRHDGIDPAIGIIEGMRVGCHHLLTSAMVEIGLAPVVLLQQFGYQIPVHIVILIVSGTQLLDVDRRVDVTIGVRRELLPLRRIVIRLERHCGANDVRIQFQQTSHDTIHIIRVVEFRLHLRDTVLHSHLDSHKHTVDMLVGYLHAALGILRRAFQHGR